MRARVREFAGVAAARTCKESRRRRRRRAAAADGAAARTGAGGGAGERVLGVGLLEVDEVRVVGLRQRAASEEVPPARGLPGELEISFENTRFPRRFPGRQDAGERPSSSACCPLRLLRWRGGMGGMSALAATASAAVWD